MTKTNEVDKYDCGCQAQLIGHRVYWKPCREDCPILALHLTTFEGGVLVGFDEDEKGDTQKL